MKIVFVTTARSDYSTMFPVIKASLQDPSLETAVFCGGMHLLPQFGETYRNLLADGISIAEKIDFMSADDDVLAMARSLGKGVELFAKALLRHKPDFVVVSGDRIENLSLFAATTALQIPVAHLCGGDITEGAFDNQIRHTMTKLSHLHFVSMDEHRRRVLQMGEEPWRISVTGDAAIDTIMQFKKPDRESLAKELGLPVEKLWVLSTFHPQTLGSGDFVSQYRNLLDVLAEGAEIPILSYPNIDPGFENLTALIEQFRIRRPDALIVKSFTRESYYGVMSHSCYMIGNSSSGLWEAPSFRLPCVNVGGRQAGRKRGDNVIDVDGFDLSQMRSAVARAKSEIFQKGLSGHNPYGSGGAAKLTLDRLKNAPSGDMLLVKKFFEIQGSF
jgi:GDP/UDP-N,N'-diacetylbacillosamine 2-epimerase (hydrolysing)